MNLQYLKKKKILADPQDEPDEENSIEPTDEEDTGDEQDASAEEDASAQVEPVSAPPDNSFTSAYKKATELPEGPATSRFSQFLQKPVPKKEDFKIGKIDRLAAILGGASEGYQKGAGAGLKTAGSVLDKPYEEGMQSYGMQGKNLEKGAEIESKNLGRAASFAKTSMTAANAQRTAELHAQDATDRAAHWDAQDKIAAKKAETAGFTKTLGADGHLYFNKVNADGTVETKDGGKVGESIPEKTKRELEVYKGKEAVRGATQKDINKSSSDNVAARESGNLDKQNSLITARTAAGEERDAAKPQAKALETQSRIRQIIAKNGDKVKDFFTPDGKGMAGPPQEGWFESHATFLKKKQQYDDAYKAVYGE